MEFKYPFPTLKSLSSIRICLNWADRKIGPFQDFSKTVESSKKPGWRDRQSHLSIDGLQMPRSLKAVVGDVLFGITRQLSFWRNEPKSRLAPEVQFFHFDAFGRFDEKRTLQPVFQKKVAEEDDLFSLFTLLTEAYDFWLLPEVGAILRKMVAVAINRQQSEVWLEGPRPEVRHGKYHLVYLIVQEDVVQSLKNIRVPVRGDLATIVLEGESIAIAPCPDTRYWSIDAFKDNFDLLEPSEKDALTENVLSFDIRRKMGIRNQLDILTFLKQKDCERNWILKLRLGDNFLQFFADLMKWPFSAFVIAAFKHLLPHLGFHHYFPIFGFIVILMPDDQQYGELHRNLLVDYWSVLTAEGKRICATSEDVYEVMEKLKAKAPSLHDAMKKEFNSFQNCTLL